ncbi:MAG TPA: sigma-70 family RNA polymerase sigma factor [Planctomycetota bacterium]|nr:sigma-70 family RNA polymerase sigma factor [Planctomycetota bacterium]
MAPDEDARLMLAFKEGDAAAFSALVERHRDGVVTYYWAMSRDRDFAEDLAQELFVKLFRHRVDYVPKASFRTYLFTLARNVWIDAYRSRRHRTPERSLDATDEEGEGSLGERLPGDAVRPEAGAERSELAEAIAKAVARLPADMREVFVLGAMQERDYAEVARTLDIPVGTVKSRMFHAVRRLRDLLSGVAQVAPQGREPRHES